MSSAADGFFMSIIAAHGSEGKSFEETRIDDYLKAYQSTGRPPQPCPQQPEDELQRKALNLPPLFKPQPIRNLTLAPSFGTSDVQLDSVARIVNPAELPPGQEFRVFSTNGEKYQCISCMPDYMNFGQEELRYYAYLAGNIRPPASVLMDPFVQTEKDTPQVTPLVEDQLQSICAQSQYDKHSHEELRIAFLLFGREMTSAEILQTSSSVNISAIPPPSIPPSQSNVSVPGRSMPPPVFAATTSTPTPKFTFGLR